MKRLAVAAVIALAIVALGYVVRGRDRAPAADSTPASSSPARARLRELRRQPPGSIAGSVAAAGAAIANATVCVRSRAPDAEARCTASDRDGAYAITDLPPGSYVIWASAPQLAGGAWRGPAPDFDDAVRLDAGQHRTHIDLALLAGAAEIRGTVRDVRGRAIPGALIHVTTEPQAAPSFTTRTTPDGRFVAWALPGEIHVLASADHFVDGDVPATAPVDDLALVLTPGAVLSGLVVEAGTRRPLDDATVTVHGGTVTRTDAAGRFELTRLAPGRYKPFATSIGGYGETAESVLLGLGQSVDDLVIEVHPVAVVAGRLAIEDDHGAPCPPDQGEVSLDRYGSSAYYRTRTDLDGAILLEGVLPGLYAVTASCDHFLSRLPYPDLAVHDSDIDGLVWTVTAGARVTGHVLSTARTPIADATVNLITVNGVGFGNAVSASDGSFTADGLAPGTTEVTAHAVGFAQRTTKPSVVTAIGTTVTVDLVLDPGGTIAGDVVDESGQPAHVRVVVEGPEVDSQSTDARGHFAIAALAAGSYELRVHLDWGVPPRASAVPPVGTATVTTGRTTQVHLIAPAPTGTIAGTVVDGRGAPVGDVYVTVALEDESVTERSSSSAHGAWHDQVLTGPDGSFELTHLPPGHFDVRAYREGGAETVVDHVAIGDHPRLTLAPTGVLAGIVVSATGGPVDDVTISADDRRHHISRDERVFHTGGRFALRDLPAGSYKLTVDGDPRSATVITLAEGAVRDDLRLVAQPRFTIRGRLVSATGAPLDGWNVEAPRISQINTTASGGTVVVSDAEDAITGPDGRFLLRNLPAGPVTISAGAVDATLRELRTLTLQSPTTDVDLGDLAVPAP
jgi:hypothetical protein